MYSTVGRMFAAGLLIGSSGHVWYKILDKVYPGTDRNSVVKKVVADLLIDCPASAWLIFWCKFLVLTIRGEISTLSPIAATGTLEGRCMKDIYSEFRVKFPTVFLLDCLVWPPAQAINFLYVPAQYRMTYVNTVLLCWNVVLSHIKHERKF